MAAESSAERLRDRRRPQHQRPLRRPRRRNRGLQRRHRERTLLPRRAQLRAGASSTARRPSRRPGAAASWLRPKASKGPEIVVFGPGDVLPDVKTAETDILEVGHTGATLHGTIERDGGPNVTGCKLEYVQTNNPRPPAYPEQRSLLARSRIRARRDPTSAPRAPTSARRSRA